MNRHWQRFFGRGLVATENDFGARGARPVASRPTRVARAGVRPIGFLAEGAAPDDRDVRDVSPELATAAGGRRSTERAAGAPGSVAARRREPCGTPRSSPAVVSTGRSAVPPVQPPQPDGVFAFTQSNKTWVASEGPDRYRRTLYTRLWRSSTHPFLTTFDFPPATVTCTRRERSNTALQALALANDPMILELAAGLGAALSAAPGDDAARLRLGFRRALAREPSGSELDLLAEHLNEVRALVGTEPAAWNAVGRVLLNLDEFVTRE